MRAGRGTSAGLPAVGPATRSQLHVEGEFVLKNCSSPLCVCCQLEWYHWKRLFFFFKFGLSVSVEIVQYRELDSRGLWRCPRQKLLRVHDPTSHGLQPQCCVKPPLRFRQHEVRTRRLSCCLGLLAAGPKHSRQCPNTTGVWLRLAVTCEAEDVMPACGNRHVCWLCCCLAV